MLLHVALIRTSRQQKNSSIMLPDESKRPTGRCGFNPGINECRLIPPPWCIAPMDGVEVPLFVALAQQHTCTWINVVTSDRLGVMAMS